MNYKNKITTAIAKIIGSIMTIVFSLVAFAHGQNCPLLPGFNPSVLANGHSTTGWKINEATYTQSCAQAIGQITCTNGSVTNGNIYPYASCDEHIWSGCTMPTGANHLEYKTLYTQDHNTYTQSCAQLSQSLQCLDTHFTGGINPGQYIYASCIQQPRGQCVDNRTTPASYKNHGETVVGYVANHPNIGQTCTTLKKILTCTDTVWSGGTQGSLFTGCNDPTTFLGCQNSRTNFTVPHGSAAIGYTSPTGNCSGLVKLLSCTNGAWTNNNLIINQADYFSGCADINAQPCNKNQIGLGIGMLPHTTFITMYDTSLAFETNNNDICSNHIVGVQCLNSYRTGYVPSLSLSCQNVTSGSCQNGNTYVGNHQTVLMYSNPIASATQSCEQLQNTFTCINGQRSGNQAPSGSPTCGGCKLPRLGGYIPELGTARGYSITGTVFPKSCSQFSAELSCSGGILNGNWQTYKYPSCSGTWLVSGLDLAINESPGLPGQENISGGVIAQKSSPQIGILFKNNGTDPVNETNVPEGFLTCKRTGPQGQNLNVYRSRVLTSFLVNPGTKVGVNIRISSLFTEAVGNKTLECTIDTSLIGGGDVSGANNTWIGNFEVVEASRFDLALSKSISSISKNLEAAEGAVGTQGVQNFLFNKIMNVIVPLIIIIGILSAILGFYKIMFSTDDTATKEGSRYIIYGVIGIILIMSAKFIGQNIFDLLWNAPGGEIKGYQIATGLYNNILYPFIKLAIYLVLGAMFVILVSRVITFLFGTDSDAQKKAGTLIGWNVISMLVIIGAKQIVEAIYGKQGDVVNQNATNLGEIGSGVLADKNIPILYQVINYALGIASLVILVIIIVQTVKLLMKPDDPAQVKSIKNSLMYMFIGILVLGAGYLIVNFAIIN